jgi:hypothetical protein
VVELFAQTQSHAVALHEPGSADAGTVRNSSHGLVKGRVAARHLETEVGASSVRASADPLGNLTVTWIEGLVCSETDGELAAGRHAINRKDAGTVEPGQLRGQLPGHAESEPRRSPRHGCQHRARH